MNRSKDLRDLFRKYLINEYNKPKTYQGYSPMYGYSTNPIGCIGNRRDIQFSKDTRIYFYEWSDTTKVPRIFYKFEAFETFLKNSGIYLEFYQKEIINNLGTVYITCYDGTKKLNIRGSYKNLIDSMREHAARNLLSNINKPKIIVEESGRWPENDGTFFG